MDVAARGLGRLGDILSVALAALAVHAAGFGAFDNVWYSGLTVALGIAATLLRDGGAGGGRRLAAQAALAALFLWLSWIWLDVMLEQEEFLVDISEGRLALAWAAFAALGYAVWRGFGLPMLFVFLLCAAYVVAPFGAGESWTRVAENLWYSTDGVYGRPVEAVGRVVLVFIVFGAVLRTSGAGELLLKMSFAATSRLAGGPAHAAIVGSGLFGTLSGSPIANVVSTGVFTMPIIKRAGFSPKFAGAVEAAASTGGQIMPPVMGVAAFLLADVTGIPYLQVVVAAAVPALFYYVSLFMVVSVEAGRLGIGPSRPEDRGSLTGLDWLRSLAFFAPLVLIVWMLTEGRTAQFAGFCALCAAVALCLALFPEFRRPRKWLEAALEAGRQAATLMVIVAAVGFVIGTINMSGVGLRFAQGILAVSGSSLFLSMLLAMLGCLALGMGVPTAPAYLIVAIVMGPALEQLGIPTIAAHLFMLYFGVLSVVTPPVALAAFAAAPIAGAGPMATGWEALRLSAAGFVIPFVFVYHPDVLIIEGLTLGGFLWATGAFLLATWMLATGLSRHEAGPLPAAQWGPRLLAAVLILIPSPAVSAAGAALAAGLISARRMGANASGRRTVTKGETK